MHYKNKCSCFIFDKSTNYKRKCRKNTSFTVNNHLNFCYFHAKKILSQYSVTIQRFWFGYKSRKILNNIYIRLNDDLQRKIKFHMKESLLIEKYNHKPIRNTIINRYLIIYGSCIYY